MSVFPWDLEALALFVLWKGKIVFINSLQNGLDVKVAKCTDGSGLKNWRGS
jgi:hypothetical protein